MEDSLVRDALLESVPPAPPMTYTADSLLRAYARTRRRRRLLGGGVSLLAVAAIVGAVVTAPHLLGRPEPSVAPVATPIGPAGKAWQTLDATPFCARATEAGTAASDDVAQAYQDYAPPYPLEPPDRVAARMSCYLMRTVPAHLPGATLYVNPYRVSEVAPRPSADDPPLKASLDAQAGPPHDRNRPSFSAAAIVADSAGVGTVTFQAYPAGSFSEQDMVDNCRSHVGACELRVGPHGETAAVWTVELPGGYRLIDVDVYIGRTIVLAVAANEDPTARPGDPGAIRIDGGHVIGRQSPPLNADQLLAIAASPELALHLTA